ncbi:hypothetical protein N7504_011620 [Penicillium tannophilum]|nr:hypothetical protein N7504_011620 [Penicillium tannophilum]
MNSFELPRFMEGTSSEYSEAQKFSIVKKALPQIRDHDVLSKHAEYVAPTSISTTVNSELKYAE